MEVEPEMLVRKDNPLKVLQKTWIYGYNGSGHHTRCCVVINLEGVYRDLHYHHRRLLRYLVGDL